MNDNEKLILDISKCVSSIEEKLNKIAENIEKIDHDIYGNGSEGLKSAVSKLQEIEKRRAKKEWLMVTSTFGIVTATIIMLIKWGLGSP